MTDKKTYLITDKHDGTTWKLRASTLWGAVYQIKHQTVNPVTMKTYKNGLYPNVYIKEENK
jgi:hypothetical protein